MRSLIILFFLISSSAALAAGVNAPDALQSLQARKGDSFSFFYVGHGYGRHKTTAYFELNGYDTPATSLLENLSLLKRFDFSVFGGDAVQFCDLKNIKVWETLLINPLAMPVLNSTGNHDYCMELHYGYSKRIAYRLKSSMFLVVSSDKAALEQESIDWIVSRLAIGASNHGIDNIFIFTHRPVYMPCEPKMRFAAARVNFWVKEIPGLCNALEQVLQKTQKNKKNVVWFSGDVGVRYPISFFSKSPNVKFVATGLNENKYDNIVFVNVMKKRIQLGVIGLASIKYGPIERYTSDWLVKFFKKRRRSQKNQASRRR